MNRANEHLPFLDGIRGFAIFAVFLFHSLGAAFGFDKLSWLGMFRDFDTSRSFLLLYPFTYGFAGVSIFFVISGFCIHLSHQRSRDKGWACFFNRRFFRIYPAYFFAICVFFFIWPWGSLQIDSFHRFAQLAIHGLAIHNLDQRSIFGINPAFWSIAVEIQLYAIYPLLMLLAARLGWRKGLMIVGVVEICIRAASSINDIYSKEPLPFFITQSPFAYWLSWSLGAYLSECFLTGRTSRLFVVRFELVAAISFLLPLFKLTDPFAFLSFSWLTAIAIDRFVTGRW
jgi:peptidoglycan/LPS O-acetylase OafA/YrhL